MFRVNVISWLPERVGLLRNRLLCPAFPVVQGTFLVVFMDNYNIPSCDLHICIVLD